MTPPRVTETTRPLEPVEHDPFIDDVSKPTPPLARSTHAAPHLRLANLRPARTA